MTGGGLDEAPRRRRTAYRSGRLELVGYEVEIPGRENKTRRKVSRSSSSVIARTPMRGKFRWKKG